VYVVSHWDKADVNPLKFASLMLNGLIDEAVGWSYMSAGAIDNATGVAVALALAAAGRGRGCARCAAEGESAEVREALSARPPARRGGGSVGR
jgi:hypothetical protein